MGNNLQRFAGASGNVEKIIMNCQEELRMQENLIDICGVLCYAFITKGVVA